MVILAAVSSTYPDFNFEDTNCICHKFKNHILILLKATTHEANFNCNNHPS